MSEALTTADLDRCTTRITREVWRQHRLLVAVVLTIMLAAFVGGRWLGLRAEAELGARLAVALEHVDAMHARVQENQRILKLIDDSTRLHERRLQLIEEEVRGLEHPARKGGR